MTITVQASTFDEAIENLTIEDIAQIIVNGEAKIEFGHNKYVHKGDFEDDVWVEEGEAYYSFEDVLDDYGNETLLLEDLFKHIIQNKNKKEIRTQRQVDEVVNDYINGDFDIEELAYVYCKKIIFHTMNGVVEIDYEKVKIMLESGEMLKLEIRFIDLYGDITKDLIVEAAEYITTK